LLFGLVNPEVLVITEAGIMNFPESLEATRAEVAAWSGICEDPQEFAATHAEAVFTAQQTFAEAQAFYTDLKSCLDAHDRHGDDVKVLPGIVPVLGRALPVPGRPGRPADPHRPAGAGVHAPDAHPGQARRCADPRPEPGHRTAHRRLWCGGRRRRIPQPA
jgi:hypothetical protein